MNFLAYNIYHSLSKFSACTYLKRLVYFEQYWTCLNVKNYILYSNDDTNFKNVKIYMSFTV